MLVVILFFLVVVFYLIDTNKNKCKSNSEVIKIPEIIDINEGFSNFVAPTYINIKVVIDDSFPSTISFLSSRNKPAKISDLVNHVKNKTILCNPRFYTKIWGKDYEFKTTNNLTNDTTYYIKNNCPPPVQPSHGNRYINIKSTGRNNTPSSNTYIIYFDDILKALASHPDYSRTPTISDLSKYIDIKILGYSNIITSDYNGTILPDTEKLDYNKRYYYQRK